MPNRGYTWISRRLDCFRKRTISVVFNVHTDETIISVLSQALTLVAGNVSNSEPYRYVLTVHVTVMSQERAQASSTHIELKTRQLACVKSDVHLGRIVS